MLPHLHLCYLQLSFRSAQDRTAGPRAPQPASTACPAMLLSLPQPCLQRNLPPSCRLWAQPWHPSQGPVDSPAQTARQLPLHRPQLLPAPPSCPSPTWAQHQAPVLHWGPHAWLQAPAHPSLLLLSRQVYAALTCPVCTPVLHTLCTSFPAQACSSRFCKFTLHIP